VNQRYALTPPLRQRRVPAASGLGLALAGLAACAPAPRAEPTNEALADSLRARIAAAYDFTRPGVAQRMAALYPDTGRVITIGAGRMTTTPDSVRAGIAAFWTNVGQNMRDANWRWDEVYVDRLGPDAAVLNGTWTIPHLAPTGRPHELRGAWTAVFRRIEGEWMIVAEHLSAPPG
jgi:hypothetical protein